MYQNDFRMNSANFLCMKLSKKWILLHLNRQKCINMHQNVCRMNYSNVLSMKFQYEKFNFFGWKLPIFFSKCSKCINMHRNASKCMQNELCKCFVHKITKEVVFITFKVAKIDELLLSLRCGRPCKIFLKSDVKNL